MGMSDLRQRVEAACTLAEEAGVLLLSYFGSDRVDTRAKGDRDVVTAADLASERLVRGRLENMFPEDGIIAEEGTSVKGESGLRWCLDPLDGTMNYSRGVPVWCVSLALFDGDQPTLGVIHDPIRGETFAASRGSGATCNGSVISTSDTGTLSDTFLHLTVDFNDDSMLQGLEDLNVLAPRVLRTRNTGSAALALAYVAAGRFDAMIHRFANAWDYGAGICLIREAGGHVTNLTGDEYTIDSFAVLAAANPALHKALRAAITPKGRVE